ncbi:hypothetical protein SUGI_0234920 [Cryptomeria japonica]|uniref:F-box/kelch-repeat protein At1g15670-like n=1 Tax=Cryptomeria japonica TaxID=3369 RepID=UPI002408C184|nr:F-box/kelch-repeat protein At1g15670-like [Cryptomeria japonica]GLJ14517.1 hypothetical protein SUGI_0234920 [Cryptomeria japonica]
MDFLQELPEQIFRDILLRVPYKSQRKIKELLEPAKEMMECSQFYQDKIKFGLAKTYVCLLEEAAITIYDPVGQSSIMRSCIPTGFHLDRKSQIVCAKHKLVLLGLKLNRNYTSTILIYDLLSNTWKQGAQIPTVTNSFACCASPEGSIYVAGGYVGVYADFSSPSRKAAVYKVDEDEWELLPDMHHEISYCGAVFLEGMIYVITCTDRTQRFDPNTRVWTTVNLSFYIPRYVYAMFGRLIAVTEKKIEQYDWEGNVWRELELLPQKLRYIQVTVWRDQIFLCGNETTPKFYMYKPGAALSQRWISLDDPKFSVYATVKSIVTIDI